MGIPYDSLYGAGSPGPGTDPKRRSSVHAVGIPAGATADLSLGSGTVEFTVRVVDAATFVPIAFTFAYAGGASDSLHLLAGESYREDNIGPLSTPLIIKLGAAVAARGEVLVWER